MGKKRRTTVKKGNSHRRSKKRTSKPTETNYNGVLFGSTERQTSEADRPVPQLPPVRTAVQPTNNFTSARDRKSAAAAAKAKQSPAGRGNRVKGGNTVRK